MPVNRFFLILLSAVFFQSQAQLIVHNPCQEIANGNKYIMPSVEYQVQVWQKGKMQQAFVYSMNAMHTTNNCENTAWVNLSFEGKIKIRVFRLKQTIKECYVLPKSSNIPTLLNKKYVEFEIKKPGHYSVEFEKGIFIDHPLLIFANPLEKNIPSATDSQVVFFDKGIHEIGQQYKISSGKTVYLSDGAYVKGQFYSEDGSNVTIKGRGILSGESFEARTADHMINLKNANNTIVDGITIIHAPKYMVVLNGKNHQIRNVKMMGWWFSTDGTSTGENSVIENCFFKVNDDAIKLYNSNTVVQNNVIWQMENGAPFMISWNGSNDFGNIVVKNNEIIRVEHHWDNENLAVICAVHGGKAKISNFVFENLNIDNSKWRIFHLITKPNRWGKWYPDKGSLENMSFKNIQYFGNQSIKSLILGHDANHLVQNMTFENIKIGNVTIKDPNDYFIIDKEFTNNINFK